MYNYLKYYHIPTVIIATKYDKIKSSVREKTLKQITDTLNLTENDKIIYFSSVTKKGKEDVLNTIKGYLDGELNEKR